MTRLGDKHYAATVYVLTDSQPRKALLLHHKKLDAWLPPGGHQEPNENSYEAAIREVMEETGIDLEPYLEKPTVFDAAHTYLPLPRMICEQFIAAHGDEPEHYHIDMEYVVYIPEQAATLQEAESHDIHWVSLEELANLKTFPDITDFLNKELSA